MSTGKLFYGEVIFVAALYVFAIVSLVRTIRRPRRKDPKEISGPYDAAALMLPGTPPPRPVRISFRGKLTALMIPAIPLSLMAIEWRDYFYPTAAWQRDAFVSFFRVAWALAAALGLFLWPIYVRHKHLLKDGEVATGLITKSYGRARNGQYVRYEFQTQSGERFSRVRVSWNNLDVGMRVPIFYDRLDPKRQIALFAAYYDLALRQEIACKTST